jgi:hypothetical protein
MKKIVLIAITATVLAATAHAEGRMGGLGFRSLSGGTPLLVSSSLIVLSSTPTIGIRQWMSERIGLDGAIGFATTKLESGGTDTGDGNGFSFDLGVPISAKQWDKVNVIVRPGFSYGTATANDKTLPTPPNKTTTTQMFFSGELEVEWMVVDRLSISASHGIAYQTLTLKDNDSPALETKVSGFETTGRNFTTLGFHVYLW